MLPSRIRLRSWDVTPLEVALVEPFVIACGTVTRTRNALVRVEIEDGEGRRAVGLGEAATLTPVTEEDLPDAIVNLTRMGETLGDRWIAIGAEPSDREAATTANDEGSDARWVALTAALDEAAQGAMVSRAGAETAVLDAIARLLGTPLFALLRGGSIGEDRGLVPPTKGRARVELHSGGTRATAKPAPGCGANAPPKPTSAARAKHAAKRRQKSGTDFWRAALAERITMTTDITIPIRPVATMAALAQGHRAQGFACFKVKVGRDVAHDHEAIVAIARAVPDARFRIDANGGFEAKDAIALVRELTAEGVIIECFEQPCATDDLGGMAEVARSIAAPVIADESVKHLADVLRVIADRAASGVNLKLAKSGGPLAALAIGRAAKRAGLSLMCGGMVETRVGMTAAAHVVGALGGVDFVDLDTAWLLAEDPFDGGYSATGASYVVGGSAGLGVASR